MSGRKILFRPPNPNNKLKFRTEVDVPFIVKDMHKNSFIYMAELIALFEVRSTYLSDHLGLR